jgi:hypothetical protein
MSDDKVKDDDGHDFLGGVDFSAGPTLEIEDEVVEEQKTEPAKKKKSVVKKRATTHNKKSSKSDDDTSMRPYVLLNIPDVLYKRITKNMLKNVKLTSYVRNLLREFLSQPDWAKQFVDAFKSESFDFTKRGIPRDMSPPISIYSPELKNLVVKLSETLNITETLVVFIMIDLQLKKGSAKTKINTSEFSGPVEI